MENRLEIEKLKRLNLVFEANRKVSRLLIKEDTPQRLTQEICDVLVAAPGYDHVWIGLFDREGKLNPMTVSDSGQGQGAMGECLENSRLPRCIQAVPKNGGGPVPDYPAQICTGCVLAEKARNGEAIAVTLSRETCCYGLMVLSPQKGWAIDPEERQIIQGMADDIALGLGRMDSQEKLIHPCMDNALTYTAILRDHRIIYENKGLEQICQPILFDPPKFSAVFEGDRERICKAYDAFVAGRTPKLQMDFQYYPYPEEASEAGGGQGLRWAYLSARHLPFRGEASVVVNIMDITDSREVETVLRIQDKMTSLGRITAGIAHEIRNPLSGIYIYLKAMKQTYDGDVTRVISIIDKIEQASNKIESIIQRVMDFSKAGRPRFVMADLNRYIDEVTKLTAVTLRKSRIILEKQLDPALPECWAEPHLIEQVILNLVTNAAEAMKAWEGEKKITLTTGLNPAGDVIRIWVIDTGPGIPKAHQDRIFDPFYTTKANSSGIGLAICHRIIRDHGGALKFSDGIGKGAQFLIELPLTSPDRTP